MISNEVAHKHAWVARAIVGSLMLVLAFVGLVLTQIERTAAWDYWRGVAVGYALLSLSLSWYMRARGLRASLFTIWHEVWHWAGLLAAIYLTTIFLKIGFFARFPASVIVITLLALATFLAGVYIEPTFVVMGIILGLLGLSVAYVEVYLYNVIIPAAVVLMVGGFWIVHKLHRRRRSH